MAAESERLPYSNGTSGGARAAQDDEAASPAASRRSVSEGDMVEVPRSTVKSQAQATSSSIPKLAPTASASPSAPNSAISSRESSPARASRRPVNSTSTPRISSRSRQSSFDRSPSRSTSGQNSAPGSAPSAAAVQRALTQSNHGPLVLTAPPNVEPASDPPSPEKSNMPIWGTPRRPENEPNQPNISSKRSPPEEHAAKSDRSAPRPVNRSTNGPGSLETVQEMASDQSTPSTETVLNRRMSQETGLPNIEENATSRAAKHHVESGSDSGGNKNSEPMAEKRRRVSSAATKGSETLVPKRSSTSLSGARQKPSDGSVRNMIVETETVSSIPQVSLGTATGDRNNSGRGDTGTLKGKPSTETIRPKKEKKRPRRPAALTSGTASSKADIFEAKVASAVDEADVSDSDETFVYESNPPDSHPARQNRYHSRTPSATSMVSQVDQLGGRARPGLRDGTHSVTGKRSMKFTNNMYNNNGADGDIGEESARNQSRNDGGGTTRHHMGRYGRRDNMYPSLFDGDSPFPQSQAHPKSPRHFIGTGFRQSRNPNARMAPNYRTISGIKKVGDAYGYDFDAEGADDERTPLVGSPRVPRSRHSNRRPNSSSLRQMEYQERRKGYFSRYGPCIIVGFLLLLIIGGATSFIVAITKSLADVQVIDIQNVLASEQEIMLDLNVLAINPNLFVVSVDHMDVNMFAKSRYVGTDQFWRDHGSDLGHFPRTEHSRKRAEMARVARCIGNECQLNSTSDEVQVKGGVDHGTDPIDSDPTGDPQTMLLGRVFRFDSPLSFEASPWNHAASTSKGQIRLPRPGNKTEEGGTARWERVLQHPFDLIVRGVIRYQLPLSSRFHSASISSSIRVFPNGDDDDDDPNHTPQLNDTVGISRLYRRRVTFPQQTASTSSHRPTLDSIREALGRSARAFIA